MESLWRPLLLAGALLFASGSIGISAPAQSTVQFNADKHLDGYEEASFSEYGYLYSFEVFESRNGTRMSEAELGKIRTEWQKEQARVAEEIRRIANDPTERSLHLLERLLRRHHFFSRVAYTRDTSFAPVVIYIQKLQKPPPRYGERLVERYGPALKRLVEVFSEKYAKPLRLTPRKGHEAFVLFILSSWGDYVNYYRAVSGRGFETAGAMYDPNLNIAVTYEDVFGKSGDREKGRQRAARYGVTHALLEAHQAFNKPSSSPVWIFEGLADLLSRPQEVEGDSGAGRPSMQALEELGRMLRDPVERKAYFLRAAELIEIRNHSDLLERIRPRAALLNDENWYHRAREVFRMEAGFFICFMMDQSAGGYGERFFALLKAALTKPDAGAAVTEAFRDLDPDAVHEEFVAFLEGELKTRCPAFKLSAGDLLALRNQPSGVLRSAEAKPDRGAPAPSPGASKLLQMNFDPSVLALHSLAPRDALGCVLIDAREGRLRTAIERIEHLKSRGLAGDMRGRVERELFRLRALEALRAFFLKSVMEGKNKLRLAHGENRFVAVLESYGDKGLSFRKTNGETIDLPLDFFDTENLLLQIRRIRMTPPEEWVLGYGYCLVKDRRWKRILKEDQAPDAALLEDIEEIVEDMVRGEVVHDLEELAGTPLPADSGAAHTILVRIKELLVSHGDHAAVKHRRKDLLQFAAHAHARLFDEGDPLEMVSMHGKIDPLEDGAVRLTYTFDDASELLDFEATDYLEEIHEKKRTLEIGKDASRFEMKEGKVICLGTGCRRLRLGLRAPFKISYTVTFELDGYQGEDIFLNLVFCDDGHKNNVTCFFDGDLEAVHRPSKFYKDGASGFDSATQPYRLEIAHDGEMIKSYLNGAQRDNIPCGPLLGGGIYLWIHTDYRILLQEVVLEGTLDPFFVAQLREDWIRAQLEALDTQDRGNRSND